MTAQRPTDSASRLAMLGGARAVPKDLRIAAWPRVTEQDEEAVRLALASGRYTTASSGEREIPGLEEEWARYTGTRHAIAVSNGTAAITVALGALGIEPGDEVIVPALSFIATAAAPLHLLAVPVFVDIDPRTYNMTPEAIEAAITPRTRAVVVVHLHGLPAEMDEITALAARHGIAVVEDAAQAHGAEYRGRRAGSIGAINTFSLNVSKNLATCGEGGLITTDDDRLATRATMLRQFGELIPERGERSYVAHLLGWNNKPSALQAAFTRSQLTRLPEESKRRDENVRQLLERVAGLPGFLPPVVPGDRTHAWHILRFRVDPAAFGLDDHLAGPLRATVQRALRAEGVPAAPYQLMPLPAQRVFRDRLGLGAYPWALPGVPERPYREADFPVTHRVIDDSFALQKAHLHPDAGPLLQRYADAFEKVWEHRDKLVGIAASMPYTHPWEQAEKIAEAEWDAAFGTEEARS
ncbi:glutamine--scyllo-inositol aminotransferase [Streptomyces eurocidicus]|uniref:Glutamine--scyllo-inositol aminotransferase n=1 Tax=Streptomyces eurocidicus TaxID=66423 RepID=A0A2N8NVP3_STREU|nr:DegT/DnrJ/EryC1/StrS family aminotransferase [Streptomyces eurocidicus]MBB5123156.1 dTDP-4-amino-4,6-dideoxygalactose transaminase [Streptomyces eurocidicus]MBF6056656.1 aminotransferase class I/II-fold pyridoxal phosphate-dependent enzyme [Streptomyces eurocidicus]PNE32847.1 glutamine--scyllo-inositol aminotransferase [Streptomyces eurocidicus]